MSLIGDDGLKKLHDLLLSRGGGIEFAAHLDKALIDMLAQVVDILTKVDKVLSHGIETCRRGLAEVAEVAAELTDVAVSGPGEHPSRRGVLFTRLYSPG